MKTLNGTKFVKSLENLELVTVVAVINEIIKVHSFDVLSPKFNTRFDLVLKEIGKNPFLVISGKGLKNQKTIHPEQFKNSDDIVTDLKLALYYEEHFASKKRNSISINDIKQIIATEEERKKVAIFFSLEKNSCEDFLLKLEFLNAFLLKEFALELKGIKKVRLGAIKNKGNIILKLNAITDKEELALQFITYGNILKALVVGRVFKKEFKFQKITKRECDLKKFNYTCL